MTPAEIARLRLLLAEYEKARARWYRLVDEEAEYEARAAASNRWDCAGKALRDTLAENAAALLDALEAMTAENRRLRAFHDAWVEAEVARATGDPDLARDKRSAVVAAHQAVGDLLRARRALGEGDGDAAE